MLSRMKIEIRLNKEVYSKNLISRALREMDGIYDFESQIKENNNEYQIYFQIKNKNVENEKFVLDFYDALIANTKLRL